MVCHTLIHVLDLMLQQMIDRSGDLVSHGDLGDVLAQVHLINSLFGLAA
jgi:hypothetical protein